MKTASILVLALAAVLAPAASSAQTRYASATVRLRTAPSRTAATVATIPRGAAVRVERCTGSGGETWCAIDYSGRSGYVAERYLSTANAKVTSTLADGPRARSSTRRARASLAVRRSPRRTYAASATPRTTRGSGRRSASSGVYHTGPRGGCYTYSASGRKRYVDHSFCN